MNRTLTKLDLVLRISKENALFQHQVHEVVQKILDYIAETLANGGRVELRDFGVFEVQARQARVGRNPGKPGARVPIPARSRVNFKPGRVMRAKVLELIPKPTRHSDQKNRPSGDDPCCIGPVPNDWDFFERQWWGDE